MTAHKHHSGTPEIKLVAIDLDGTLLDDRKRISPPAAKALTSLPKRGVKVVIASARPPRSVRHVYEALRLDTWQVNYNGAMIWDEPNQKVPYHLPLPGPVVRQVVEHARRIHPKVQVSCELMDRWYTDRMEIDHMTETGRLFKPDVIAPLKEFLGVSMTKVLFLGDRQLMDDIETTLSMAFDEHIALVRAEDDLIQIMHKRADKSAALKIVAEHYDVPLKNVMAIGDASNDLGMLRAAGVGVAMDNAHPAIKEAADWVAPSNNDHGVHAALVRYGLSD